MNVYEMRSMCSEWIILAARYMVRHDGTTLM